MNEPGFINYYELLGVDTDDEPKLIRAAFLRLATEHHPDVGGSAETMQQLTKAYKTLMSDRARRLYDVQHDLHVPGAHRYHNDAWDSVDVDDLSDSEIDEFLDTLYEEYKNKPKEKKTIKSVFKSWL